MPATLSCFRALVGAVFAAWAGSCAAAPPLEVFTTEAPPFSFSTEDGRITGMSADVVAEAARRAEVPIVIRNHLPWARAFAMAQERRDTCAFSVSRRPDRESLFQWVGPIAVNRWALFARADFAGRIETLEDVKRYRVGGLRADAKTEFLTARGIEVDAVAEDRTNPTKLMMGRIDLWVTGLYTARDTAAPAGVNGLKLVLVFHEAPSYLACSRSTPTDTVARLNAAFEALRKEGFLKKVHELHASRFAWY